MRKRLVKEQSEYRLYIRFFFLYDIENDFYCLFETIFRYRQFVNIALLISASLVMLATIRINAPPNGTFDGTYLSIYFLLVVILITIEVASKRVAFEIDPAFSLAYLYVFFGGLFIIEFSTVFLIDSQLPLFHSSSLNQHLLSAFISIYVFTMAMSLIFYHILYPPRKIESALCHFLVMSTVLIFANLALAIYLIYHIMLSRDTGISMNAAVCTLSVYLILAMYFLQLSIYYLEKIRDKKIAS